MDRDEFMELVYETFADEPDNVLANGIIEAADAYAEHEKAQLSQEGTTSDTISRTEVVEHLRRVLEATVPNTDYDEGYIDGIEFGISTVSTMPPAQPQSTTGQLNDGAQSTNLIDRQAAIDAVDAIGHIATMSDGDKCIRRSAVKYTLSMLPTSQPVATDTNVGDTISRQAVIDVIEDYPHGVWNVENMEDMVDKIKALTSVQPEECTEKRTKTHACDLISRQAAIDAAKERTANSALAILTEQTND